MKSNFEVILALDFLVCFTLAYAISRGLLYLLKKWRSRWYVVLGIHVTTFLVCVALAPTTVAWIWYHGGFDYYLLFSNGFALNLQILLFIVDLIANSTWWHNLIATKLRTNSLRTVAAAVPLMLVIAISYSSARELYFPFGNRELAGGRLQREIEAALAENFRTPILISAMKKEFPAEYHNFVATEVSQLTRAGADRDKYSRVWQGMPSKFVNFAGSVVQAHVANIVHAPDSNLIAIAKANVLMIEAVRKEPSLCAGFAGGQLSKHKAGEAASPQVTISMNSILAMELAAARAGIQHPVVRNLDDIAPDYSKNVAVELQSEVNDKTMTALRSRQLLTSLSDTEKCGVGIATLRTVAKLPKAQAAQMTAYLLARRWQNSQTKSTAN